MGTTSRSSPGVPRGKTGPRRRREFAVEPLRAVVELCGPRSCSRCVFWLAERRRVGASARSWAAAWILILLTSGDPLPARDLHGRPLSLRALARLLLAASRGHPGAAPRRTERAGHSRVPSSRRASRRFRSGSSPCGRSSTCRCGRNSETLWTHTIPRSTGLPGAEQSRPGLRLAQKRYDEAERPLPRGIRHREHCLPSGARSLRKNQLYAKAEREIELAEEIALARGRSRYVAELEYTRSEKYWALARPETAIEAWELALRAKMRHEKAATGSRRLARTLPRRRFRSAATAQRRLHPALVVRRARSRVPRRDPAVEAPIEPTHPTTRLRV